MSILSESNLSSIQDLAATVQALRTHIAVFDVSDRTQIEITGADRTRFLHGLVSNDIKRLKVGQGCETFITDLKGRVVAHVYVFCGENSLWLDGSPGQDDVILRHLGKYLLIDDVQLHSRTAERSELLVTGTMASQLLQLDDPLPIASHLSRDADGQPFDIRRVDLLDAPGYLISVPKSRRDTVLLGLRTVGVVEGSEAAFQALRIAAGSPTFGVDISNDNLAQEVARNKQCISFDKGCYLGQETVARLDALGHTNRELRRMVFETSDVPTVGSTVFDASGETEVGILTSAAVNPDSVAANSTPSIVALGLLKRAALASNTPIQLDPRIVQCEGRVV